MKIAVTYDNGQIFQHFGHTEQFKLYDVEDGTVTAQTVVDAEGEGHGTAGAGAKSAWRGYADMRRHRRGCAAGAGAGGDSPLRGCERRGRRRRWRRFSGAG